MTELQGLWVALSGSVPALEELKANGWDVQAFHWMVKNLAAALLEKGVGIVHGCHPSYTPLVADVARKFAAPLGKPVRMLAISSFYPTREVWEAFVKQHPYAEVEPIDSVHTPLDDALDHLATQLSDFGQAFICIGGRAGRQSLRTNKQQVEDELDKAQGRSRPIYLLGGCGGLSRKLFEDRFKQNPSKMSNGLQDDDNQKLASAGPWDAPSLVLQGLYTLRSQGQLLPTKFPKPRGYDWNTP